MCGLAARARLRGAIKTPGKFSRPRTRSALRTSARFAEVPDGRIRCATPNKIWEFDGRNWMDLRGGFARINGLCNARDGTLWVATDDAAYRYTPGTWIANGPEDGLPAASVRAITEDAAGKITATTPAGVATFHPEADLEPPRSTFILADADEENNFREGAMVTLAFRGRDKWKLTAASRLLFSYRLDEREWSAFQEIREISFSDLPLGKHYFQVRAMDRNGNIDPKPARLEFAVACAVVSRNAARADPFGRAGGGAVLCGAGLQSPSPAAAKLRGSGAEDRRAHARTRIRQSRTAPQPEDDCPRHARRRHCARLQQHPLHRQRLRADH